MRRLTTCGLRIRDHKWVKRQISVGGRVIQSVQTCRRCKHEITATVEGWQPSAPLTAADLLALTGSGLPYPVAPHRTVKVDESGALIARYFQRFGDITIDGELGPQTWVVMAGGGRR